MKSKDPGFLRQGEKDQVRLRAIMGHLFLRAMRSNFLSGSTAMGKPTAFITNSSVNESPVSLGLTVPVFIAVLS